MIAALVTDLTSNHRTVILHLCRGVVDAFPLGPLGVDLAFDLDLLLMEDGGAVGTPPVNDDGSGF